MENDLLARDDGAVSLFEAVGNASVAMDAEEEPAAGLWNRYRSWASTHHTTLHLVDETVSRLLFWTSRSSRWREIMWGLLELHRVLLDQATTTTATIAPHDRFGTTVFSVSSLSNTSSSSVGTWRLCLTLLQSLWPIVQELVCSSRSDVTTTQYRQAQIRKYLERMRLILRLSILFHYWRQLSNGDDDNNNIVPGLLCHGGLYHYHPALSYSVPQEARRLELLQYVGRRTGRRLTVGNNHATATTTLNLPRLQTRVKLGEILYIIRPWLQAELEAIVGLETSQRWTSWLLCLGLDSLSLWCLKHPSVTVGNAGSAQEWKRRRVRLLLYLLRAPVWTNYSEPTLQRISGIIVRIPLFGGLLNNYVWDWIYYWKLYRADEG